MNDTDLNRIATRGHRTAQLVADHANRARQRATANNSPLRAANYDATRSTRHEPYGERDTATGLIVEKVAAIPNDPTGETALHGTSNLAAELRLTDALNDYDQAITNLTRIILALVPEARADATNATPLETDINGPGEGWCRSCWRDDQHMNPEHTHRDGTPKHKGLCAWCHDFTGTYRNYPPLPILRLRHAGRRITQADIARHIPKKAG